MDQRTVMSVDLKPGERVSVSPGIEIELTKKTGQLARLKITADRNVRIVKETAPSMAR